MVESQKTEQVETRDGFPVKIDWSFSKCGMRYALATSGDESFRRRALEDLYTVVDPGGCGIVLPGAVKNRERCERLLNELAVELVGGIPAGCEEYT